METLMLPFSPRFIVLTNLLRGDGVAARHRHPRPQGVRPDPNSTGDFFGALTLLGVRDS